MIKVIRRSLVTAAAVLGVLVLSAPAAQAGMSLNHCEPLRQQ